MNANRKKRLKAKRLAREEMKIILRRQERFEWLNKKLMKRNPDSFVASFRFAPEEIGIIPAPKQETIDKIGIERAMQRLDRADFFTNVSVRVKGDATAEHLKQVREEVRLDTFNKVKAGQTGLDLSQFTAMNNEPGVLDEVQPQTD